MLTKVPERRLTAPNNAIDLRVDACSKTGSFSSGGTHITHREPCCWKWHSSRLHNARSSRRARRRSFFISPLGFRVGLGDQGARLAPPEAQVPENALTLPHAEVNRIRFVQVVGQELAVPEVLAVAIVPGRLTQRVFQLGPL